MVRLIGIDISTKDYVVEVDDIFKLLNLNSNKEVEITIEERDTLEEASAWEDIDEIHPSRSYIKFYLKMLFKKKDNLLKAENILRKYENVNSKDLNKEDLENDLVDMKKIYLNSNSDDKSAILDFILILEEKIKLIKSITTKAED